jgi:transposase
MTNIRKNHSALFKTKVAIEALKETMTQSELSSKFGVHASRIATWKKLAVESIRDGFLNKSERAHSKEDSVLINELYQEIGQQKVELDWLKKKSGFVS